jgi:hypothetical protein
MALAQLLSGRFFRASSFSANSEIECLVIFGAEISRVFCSELAS